MFFKVWNKYKDLAIPVKAIIWFTMCNVLVKGISFITLPIFTRILSDNEYGKLSVIMSYSRMISIFSTWELERGAYQKGIFKYKNDISTFTTASQLLINVLTCCFFVVVLIINNIITVTNLPKSTLILLFLYLLVEPAYNCWLIRKRTEYLYKQAVGITILYAIFNVLFPIVALCLINKTAVVKFNSSLIGTFIICLVFYLPNAKYYKLEKKWIIVKEQWLFLVKFQAPLIFHSLSFMVLSQADRIMINYLVGSAQAAYYSVGYNIASIITILQTSVNQVVVPWRYQMLDKKDYNKIKILSNYLIFGLAIIICFLILVFPEIIKMLFTKNYYEAIWSMPPVTVSVYFMFLYNIFAGIETYFGKTQYIMYVSVVCACINIILNYVSIQLYGYIACGYTTLISYILFAIGHYYFMKKILNKNNIIEAVVDIKTIFIISISVIVISILFTLVYPYPIVRYSFVSIMLLTIVKKRNSILKTIKEYSNK